MSWRIDFKVGGEACRRLLWPWVFSETEVGFQLGHMAQTDKAICYSARLGEGGRKGVKKGRAGDTEFLPLGCGGSRYSGRSLLAPWSGTYTFSVFKHHWSSLKLLWWPVEKIQVWSSNWAAQMTFFRFSQVLLVVMSNLGFGALVCSGSSSFILPLHPKLSTVE